MPMSDAVPNPIARGNVRCGSIASPAEKVTYCQPSYAQSTPIMPRPMPDAIDGVSAGGQNGAGCCRCAPPNAIRTTPITSSAPTLIAVLQFWTSALRRVLRTLIAATIASRAIAVAFCPNGPSATNCWTYDPDGTARVAADPVAITRKNVQP